MERIVSRGGDLGGPGFSPSTVSPLGGLGSSRFSSEGDVSSPVPVISEDATPEPEDEDRRPVAAQDRADKSKAPVPLGPRPKSNRPKRLPQWLASPNWAR